MIKFAKKSILQTIKTNNDPYQALKYKEFSLYIFARFLLTMSISIPVVLLGWWLYELTNDKIILGNFFLAELLPAIGLALFSGRIVDRTKKKRLITYCYIGYIIYASILLWATLPSTVYSIGNQIVIYIIYGASFLNGVIRSFIEPASFSFVAQLTPREAYINASTWTSTSWIVGAILGPTLAGFLYAMVGITNSFLIMIFFIIIAFICLLFIKEKPISSKNEEQSFWQSLIVGLKFVFKEKAILAALSLDMFAVLFGGAVALLPVYAIDILHIGKFELGVLRAATFLGTLFTLLTLAYIPIKTKPGIKLLVAIFMFGVSIILFGISTNFYLSFICLFFSGIFDGISVNIRRAILQLKTPDEMRGRVAAVNSMFIGSSNELGAYESGVTAKYMGTVPSVVFGGSMTIIIVLITWWKAKSLKEIDLN